MFKFNIFRKEFLDWNLEGPAQDAAYVVAVRDKIIGKVLE